MKMGKFLKPTSGEPGAEHNKSQKPADKEGGEPGPAPARDLTDEELKRLSEAFERGLEAAKGHPWNGEED
jgi:hypothetical protein